MSDFFLTLWSLDWEKEAIDKELQEGDFYSPHPPNPQAFAFSEWLTDFPFYSFQEAWSHKALNHSLVRHGVTVVRWTSFSAFGEMQSWGLPTKDSDRILIDSDYRQQGNSGTGGSSSHWKINTALLRYIAHTTQVTHLKYAIQCCCFFV